MNEINVAELVNSPGKQKTCELLLELQTCPTVAEVWKFFLAVISKTHPVKEAQLIYQAGIFFKTIFSSNAISGKNETKDLKDYEFLKTEQNFDHRFSAGELTVFRRIDNYLIQCRLVFSDGADGIDSDTANLLAFAHMVLNQVALLLRIENFEFHSIKDDITLAYNQKYLRTFLRNEIERCKRYPSVFSLVFFDLDNLKAINEAHGHLVGTEVLRQVAKVLRNQVRKIDLLSRFGGDEFVIVLLRANADKAYEICVRIKKHMEESTFLQEQQIDLKMTGCFGISYFPRDGDTVETLIKKADTAMYEVKRKGKNGIKIYEGD